MRRKLKIAIAVLVMSLVAFSVFADVQEDQEFKTYMFVENESVSPEYARIDFSFLGEKSSIIASASSIEVVKFAYLTDAEISTILSQSWILDEKDYSSDPLNNARVVFEAIRRYLDGRYPYTGPITAEIASQHFSDTISMMVTPYQMYSVSYFDIRNQISSDEVNYFSATYSAGLNFSWNHKFTQDFGVGASAGFNYTYGEGESFINLSPMFQMAATMFRLGTIEGTTRLGFGGYITINESSVSFIPGLSASLGLSITVSSNISFILESGLDVGLWLWRSMSSEGFMLAIQKPLSLGVGVRI